MPFCRPSFWASTLELSIIQSPPPAVPVAVVAVSRWTRQSQQMLLRRPHRPDADQGEQLACDGTSVCLPAPRGLLICGIAGTGKSLTAKATANIFGLPLLKLDAGRIFAGLVGQSESNLRAVIQTAEAMVLKLAEYRDAGLIPQRRVNDIIRSTMKFPTGAPEAAVQ